MHDRLQLPATILAQWQCPVASTKALDILHRAMCAGSYRRTASAIKTAGKAGPIFHRCFVCCHPGGCRGNTEQVVNRWRHLVASGVALDMPDRATLSVLLQPTRMAMETAYDGGAFVFCRCLFCLT
jgi:hypothetical protein